MDKHAGKVFKSELDKSFMIVFLVAILQGVFLAVKLSWLGWASLILIAGIALPILFNTYYRIHQNTLYVKSGFLYKREIDIQTIYKINEIKNMNSAPALSVRRLEIFYNRFDSVLISPKEEKLMIEELLNINPDIELIRPV